MGEPFRTHRVIAFCDWLETIPPNPPFHTLPEFRFYRGLSSLEVRAAQAELRRRAAAGYAEAEQLELDVLDPPGDAA